MFDLSVVVPCYNSGKWIDELTRRIVATLDAMNVSFELLLVNDSSTDDTWEVIELIADRDTRICGIDLQFNAGQYRATICGMEHASGNLIVTIDDDLQHAPEDIPRLVEVIQADSSVDCILAAFKMPRANLFRRSGTFIRDVIAEKLYGKPRGLKFTAFRVMRRSTSEAICAHRTSRPLLLATLLKCARCIKNVEVDHHARVHGRSGYSIRRLVGILWNTAVFGSTVPLRMVGGIGLVSVLISVVLGTWYLLSFAFGGIQSPGFATIVLLLLFFGGTTLSALGILGEYVVRVVEEVARPPRYYVRQSTRETANLSSVDA